MLEIITGLLSASNLATLVMLFITLKSSKKKAEAEAKKSNSESKISDFEATEKIIEIYNKLSEDLRSDYERRIANCLSELKELRSEVESLKKLKCTNSDCPNRKQ